MTSDWNILNESYSSQEWVSKPSIFLEQISRYLPKCGKVLELGCGQGQDTVSFLNKGYSVIAIDYSKNAVEATQSKIQNNYRNLSTIICGDISRPLDFADNSFDIVYSHLALHYFDYSVTTQIFSEIARLLKSNGILALLLNSTSDPEYLHKQRLEQYLCDVNGVTKRYFNLSHLKEFTSHMYQELLIDELGETYKDKLKDVHGLVRFVGRRVTRAELGN